MVHLEHIKSVFLIGVGGIGMSALARFFKLEGKEVAGYDKTASDLTDQLVKEGIDVHFEDRIDLIGAPFSDPAATLVVYTPAIPANHAQLVHFQANGFAVMKRAAVLGLLTQGMNGVCVAGTHGKTTISSLTAHLFKQSEVGCNAFLGGITKNYKTNFLHDANSSFVVLEADEFDRSFLHLTPHLALVSAMDADHLDIYGDESRVHEAFNAFVGKIEAGGALLHKAGLPIALPDDDVEVFSYALEGDADFYAFNLKLLNGLYTFSLQSPFGVIHGLQMGIPGRLNVENAVGAIGLALLAGVDEQAIKKALPTFEGIKRRFEYHLKTDRVVFIDDYAHHPAEIEATVTSVKAIYPNLRLTAVFQPHLFTRTRDFADAFAAALDLCDQVLLLDIYPAREEPIAGITSDWLAGKMKNTIVKVVQKRELVQEIRNLKPELLLTMGAGDIDRELCAIRTELEKFITNK